MLRRPSRRMTAAVGAIALAAAVATAVALPLGGGGSGNASASSAESTSLATVERRALSSQTQVSATLGYADSSSVVIPAGTSPADLRQAQQAAASAESTLQSAQMTLSVDGNALAIARAQLTAAQRKLETDCSGDGATSTTCTTETQALTTLEPAVTTDSVKVTSDRATASADERALAADSAALAAAEDSAAGYTQTSTYTMLPSIGAVIRRGEALYAISGAPVLLLYGRVTAWRAFRAGMSSGRDVRELNANLRLAGDAFTTATENAIRRFQGAHGLAQTGELLLGAVVFEPGAIRVTSVTPSVGAAVQAGAVLGVTSTRRVVSISLDATQQSQVKVGDKVTITLPDQSTTPGVVSYVGTVATTQSGSNNSNSTPTIEVDVTPTDPAATGRLDQAPVNVSITTATVNNAFVVPVGSLLALAGGGYAVEVVDAGGVHRLV
ncbi:MAG TPA: peptidoglycan-binding protein, partial [Gaiellaceae bacterium]|nr:peptidoglycan-binding protein [Gaiellaceae bacterium]